VRELLSRDAPDGLLTDLGLPDGNGIELIRELRRSSPGSAVIVITTFGDEKTVIAPIEAGASGYLLKDGSVEEIGAALVELAAGGSPIRPSIARQILRRLQREDAEPKSAAPHLTERAHEISSSIAEGFSFPEIAGLLSISTHTVTTRVRHIYRRLEVTSRASAVYEAVQLGLIRIDG